MAVRDGWSVFTFPSCKDLQLVLISRGAILITMVNVGSLRNGRNIGGMARSHMLMHFGNGTLGLRD